MSTQPDTSGTELLDLTLPTLVRRAQAGPERTPLLVLLHGWGANEGDIYELAQFVDKRITIAAPRGAGQVSDDPRGSYAWYDRERADGVIKSGLVEISLAKLTATLDDLLGLEDLQLDPSQVYIGGFSQGAVMSLILASTLPNRLAGILPHSGFVRPDTADRLRTGVFRGKPVFVAHGVEDNIIPIELGREVKGVLEASGVDLTYKEYPFGHVTSETSRQDLANWLNTQLKFQA